MNSEEGVSLAKMAVTVLLVVLVIGAVVAVVYMAYAWFTSGTDKLGDTVNSLDSSSYSQYDDNQCSGTDVLTALKSYRDSDIAILISNSNNVAAGYNADPATYTGGIACFNYCGLVDGATANTALTSQVSYNATAGRFEVVKMQWDTNGLTKRNTNFSPTTDKSKDAQFVRQNAQWYSNLVYDNSTGEVCGILFRQMN